MQDTVLQRILPCQWNTTAKLVISTADRSHGVLTIANNNQVYSFNYSTATDDYDLEILINNSYELALGGMEDVIVATRCMYGGLEWKLQSPGKAKSKILIVNSV